MAGEDQKRKIPYVRAVTPMAHHRLYLEFGSGSVLDLSLEHRLRSARYYDLNDDRIFYSAVTDGSKIIFDTGTRFALELQADEAIERAVCEWDGTMTLPNIRLAENGQLRLEMENTSVLTLNMAYWLNTVRYSPLKESEVLQAVRTDGEALFFGGVLTISLQELTRLALTIPPAGKEETV
ncbi:MAG: hypothetical protein PHE09_02800 [Oscillospiraceae bacterium]|nr:hypothetical protein [Oscillospiraceae bacterium]